MPGYQGDIFFDSAQLSFVLWVLGFLGCTSIVNNADCCTEDGKLLPICHAAAKNLRRPANPCSNRAPYR